LSKGEVLFICWKYSIKNPRDWTKN
jgi:hypothetical protein